MKLELEVFSREELIRVCHLIGVKNIDGVRVDHGKEDNLREGINDKIDPDGGNLKQLYKEALDLFKINYRKNISKANLRLKLYQYSRQKLEQAMEKLSKKKKRLLTAQLENSLDPTAFEVLKKKGKTGVKAGAGILLLQGGAIAITSSNLGICMLLTSGLSGISGIIGITFPFAAYTSVAIAGGWIVQTGHFLASPWTAIPLIGVTLWLIYRKAQNKKYINLAGVNYLIESKKLLGV